MTPRWALRVAAVCPVVGDSGYGSPGRSDTKVALDVSPFRQWGGIVAVGPSRAIKLCSYVINLGGSQAFSVLGFQAVTYMWHRAMYIQPLLCLHSPSLRWGCLFHPTRYTSGWMSKLCRASLPLRLETTSVVAMRSLSTRN